MSLIVCVIFQGIDILPQDLKLAVRLNHKQESTAKQGKYLRSVHKINLRLYACYLSFTHLSGTIGGTFIFVSCRNDTNRRKNMGFSLVCVEKKVHIRNMFNVSKQLCFFLAQG